MYNRRHGYVPRVVAFLNANPNNPTGKVMGEKETSLLKEIGEVCLKRGVFVIDDLVYRKIITLMEGNSININKLYSYTKSDLYNQIKKAKYVFKEQPFYINLTSDEVYGNGLEDNILVQGIIDLYFINENDEVILVDYKTDYVEKNKEQELIDKYKKQLDIYKKALEQSLKKNIHKTYIYSVYLEKLIEI